MNNVGCEPSNAYEHILQEMEILEKISTETKMLSHDAVVMLIGPRPPAPETTNAKPAESGFVSKTTLNINRIRRIMEDIRENLFLINKGQ